MADKQSTAFCHVCGQQRLFMKPRINHVLHLILTIVTAGLWGIVWIILGISNSTKPLRCTACGSPMGAGAGIPVAQAAPAAPPPPPQAAPPPPPPPPAPAVPEGTPPPSPAPGPQVAATRDQPTPGSGPSDEAGPSATLPESSEPEQPPEPLGEERERAAPPERKQP